MATLFGGTIHSALVHAATEQDRKQEARAAKSRRGYHNPYALAQYLARIEEVESDIAAGATVRAALVAAFSDRLLDHMLRAVGEAPHAREEKSAHWVYVPASER